MAERPFDSSKHTTCGGARPFSLLVSLQQRVNNSASVTFRRYGQQRNAAQGVCVGSTIQGHMNIFGGVDREAPKRCPLHQIVEIGLKNMLVVGGLNNMPYIQILRIYEARGLEQRRQTVDVNQEGQRTQHGFLRESTGGKVRLGLQLRDSQVKSF